METATKLSETKTSAQNVERITQQIQKEERIDKLKKIETDCNRVFCKLVSLAGFQSSFLLFVTFQIMFGRYICFTFSFLRNF